MLNNYTTEDKVNVQIGKKTWNLSIDEAITFAEKLDRNKTAYPVWKKEQIEINDDNGMPYNRFAYVTFNVGQCKIIIEGNTYFIVARYNDGWKKRAHIFPEAVSIIKRLPNLPSDLEKNYEKIFRKIKLENLGVNNTDEKFIK